MKFVSWNINGLRAVLKKGFLDFVDEVDADVICLQEVRALPEQVDFDVPGYEAHWYPAEKKGYSGTMFLSRVGLGEVNRGLGSRTGRQSVDEQIPAPQAATAINVVAKVRQVDCLRAFAVTD